MTTTTLNKYTAERYEKTIAELRHQLSERESELAIERRRIGDMAGDANALERVNLDLAKKLEEARQEIIRLNAQLAELPDGYSAEPFSMAGHWRDLGGEAGGS